MYAQIGGKVLEGGHWPPKAKEEEEFRKATGVEVGCFADELMLRIENRSAEEMKPIEQEWHNKYYATGMEIGQLIPASNRPYLKAVKSYDEVQMATASRAIFNYWRGQRWKRNGKPIDWKHEVETWIHREIERHLVTETS
jgi:hypothetical protein